MKRLFFKSLNISSSHSHSVSRRRLRISDILLADEDHGAVDSMDGVPETPMHISPPSTKCYSPRRLVARLLAALRFTTKERRVVQRLRNEAGDSETPSPSPMTNDLRGNEEESGQLHGNDASFKLGVGCGLLYLIAATKNELGKMVELRKEMETLLQNVKGELQNKDALLETLKQSDALACSITDIQEVSTSNSHFSIPSHEPYVQPEYRSNMVCNRFLDSNASEQDECAEEINELQAEFEFELQRLQLYLDGEATFEDAQRQRVEDSRPKSQSSSFDEIIMEPQGASSVVSFGVPPVELERRLHELLEARLQERITELESALDCTTRKLNEKEIEVTCCEDTAKLIPQHVPETSRFTFSLDPEIALKLSQIV